MLGLPLRLPYEPGQGWAGFRAGDVVLYFIQVLVRIRELVAAHARPGVELTVTGGFTRPAFEDDVSRTLWALALARRGPRSSG